MREAVLHHIWKFKKFDVLKAKTQDKQPITIQSVGQHNTELSGPDFFNAKLQIGDQLWAGNVEIHLKSSDWYAHNHETDSAYDNVILHVVWEDDVEVYRQNHSVIPTLVLKDLVAASLIEKTKTLLDRSYLKWIPCENDFPEFEDFLLENWLERLYIERLQSKTELILTQLKTSQNDWEAVCFQMMVKAFGLNVNGAFFLDVARSTPYNIVRKVMSDSHQFEALFLGQANLLDHDSDIPYEQELLKEYKYLKNKYKIESISGETPKFFRLRPHNFPTIRLVQMVSLFQQTPQLFSKIIEAETIEDLRQLFVIKTIEFWKTHYTFSKKHASKEKPLTKSFVNLLIINVIAPMLFCYYKFQGKENNKILKWMQQLSSEKNNITKGFNELRPNTSQTALHSQALLTLKKQYCEQFNCLACNLGVSLLRVDD